MNKTRPGNNRNGYRIATWVLAVQRFTLKWKENTTQSYKDDGKRTSRIPHGRAVKKTRRTRRYKNWRSTHRTKMCARARVQKPRTAEGNIIDAKQMSGAALDSYTHSRLTTIHDRKTNSKQDEQNNKIINRNVTTLHTPLNRQKHFHKKSTGVENRTRV